jgi:hypothetical protein
MLICIHPSGTIARRVLSLIALLSLMGCVHIQMNTHIESSGRCLRTLDVSVPQEWAETLKAAGTRGRAGREVALAEEEQWEETERAERGRHHRLLAKWFPDPEAMSDRMIELSFGRVVRTSRPTDSDDRGRDLEVIRGDRVDFDMKKGLWGTTFLYEEIIQLHAQSDVGPEPVRVEVEILMPGKIVHSNADRIEGHRASWTFQVTDKAIQIALSVTSQTSDLPMLIPMGLLILGLVIFLPGQLLSKRERTRK